MTVLSLAARNFLVQDTGLTGLLAESPTLGPWIFDSEPVGARFEQNSKCLIVISEENTWTSPNEHNTLRFPRLFVDIWADPDRNPDKSVRISNAKTKIGAIQAFIDKHMHLVDPGTPQGMPFIWGTPDQIANKTGVVIVASERRDGPEFSPIANAQGAWMGRLTYGITTP